MCAVLRMRAEGRPVPRHNLAFATPFLGVLRLGEERMPELNRHATVARLLDAETGRPVDGLLPLVDARVVRVLADEIVLTGFERVSDGLTERDCAQSWVARMESLRP